VLLAAAAVAVSLSLGGNRALAQSELSGNWDVTYTIDCAVSVEQTGDMLAAVADCGKGAPADLTGSVSDGIFSLEGFFNLLPVSVEGSVTPDGSAMGGIWSLPPLFLAAEFEGTRITPIGDPADLTGDWAITIHSGVCTASLEQNASALAADFDCGVLAATLAGTYNPSTGDVSLGGAVFEDATLQLTGSLQPDGQTITGTWLLTPVDLSGDFEATLQAAAAPTPTGTANGTAGTPSPVPDSTAPTATIEAAGLPAAGQSGGDSATAVPWPVLAALVSAAVVLAGVGLLALRKQV
jgi:hypothetical protein